MLGYKIKNNTIHIILEDSIYDGIQTRPPTENEITHIQKRERLKRVKSIIEAYQQRNTPQAT